MTVVRKFKANTPTSELIEVIKNDGCVVIEAAMDSENLDILKTELTYLLDRTPSCKGDFYGHQTKRLSGLIQKSKTIREMVVHPKILKLMDEFLLPGCDQYQLNLTQAISIGSGEPQQIIHRDDAMFPFEKQNFEAMINCMWAIDDFTFDNGATHLVPGSHKWEQDRLPEPEEITQGVMKAGSVLLYLGSLIHGGGANRTQKSRTGVVLSYCCGWLRQAENQYLAVSVSEAKKYSTRLQELLGYFVHKPNLGSVEGRDPIEILNGQNIENAIFTEFLPDEVKPAIKEFMKMQVAAA